MNTHNDDLGKSPAWLEDAAAQWDAIDAEASSPLAQCQESAARLRAALMAAHAIMDRAGLHDAATLVWNAANAATPAAQWAAVAALEDAAGYIADPDAGECYP